MFNVPWNNTKVAAVLTQFARSIRWHESCWSKLRTQWYWERTNTVGDAVPVRMQMRECVSEVSEAFSECQCAHLKKKVGRLCLLFVGHWPTFELTQVATHKSRPVTYFCKVGRWPTFCRPLPTFKNLTLTLQWNQLPTFNNLTLTLQWNNLTYSFK